MHLAPYAPYASEILHRYIKTYNSIIELHSKSITTDRIKIKAENLQYGQNNTNNKAKIERGLRVQTPSPKCWKVLSRCKIMLQNMWQLEHGQKLLKIDLVSIKCKKMFGSRGSAPDPVVKLTVIPRPPAGGGGWLSPPCVSLFQAPGFSRWVLFVPASYFSDPQAKILPVNYAIRCHIVTVPLQLSSCKLW